MTDPIDLQKRISHAFDSSVAPHDGERGRTVIAPPPLAADDVFNPPLRAPARRLPSVSPYLFGGVGLLASAAVLAIGEQGAVYAVVGALASIGLGALALHFVGRAPTVKADEPVVSPVLRQAVREEKSLPALSRQETDEDERWSVGETHAVQFSMHDAMGDIALIRTLDGRIVAANAVFCDLVGVAAPQGQSCKALGLQFEAAGKPGCFEVDILTPRGRRTFFWHDVMLRDPGSGRLMLQSLARDVTDERQLDRIREAERARAEAASAAKSQLLATVSHEIRTPLGGILGMASLLSRTRLNPEQTSYLQGIRQSGEALGQLVDELLDFSSMEAGRFVLNPQETDVRPFVEAITEMLAHRAHDKGLEIAVTVDADVPERFTFDAARVRQVLFNVIGNAVKFTRHGGVLVAASMNRSDLVLTVTDTGVGMTEKDMAAIFGEFEQAGDAEARSGGTGLGLSISSRIMAALGGSLSVSSRKGAGSTFTIRLPVEAAGASAGTDRASRLARSNVLLLAPAGPAATATLATLATLGANCRHVTSAPEAVRALQSARGSAAFSDIIVDHRLAAAFTRLAPAHAEKGPRRVFLVNPEARATRRNDDFDAWLIRPLREKSLTDVLTGKMSGVEKRDALNDNRPLPGFGSQMPVEADGASLRVLLAEDDPVNALLTRAGLEKAGHQVTHVCDFETVLALLNDPAMDWPDLLVTDLNMPGGEGCDVIARIRADEREKGRGRMPIIVVTADKRRQAAQRALLSGADCLLEKPATFERLGEEIKVLIGSEPAHVTGG